MAEYINNYIKCQWFKQTNQVRLLECRKKNKIQLCAVYGRYIFDSVLQID